MSLVAKPLDAAELERKLIAAARVTELHRRLHADARQDALTAAVTSRRVPGSSSAMSTRIRGPDHAKGRQLPRRRAD